MAVIKKMASTKTETDVAVLQVQVKNIDDKVCELKEDVKGLSDTIEKHAEDNQKMLKEMKDASSTAHKAMDEKISTLEKWRWMMMGAGVVLGAMGHNVWGSLLK
jgi:uncharacterized protein YlxW (UPF0749 family)